MIDLEAIAAEREAMFAEYRAWASSRACLGCGKLASDRPRDAEGNVLEKWITEECCMDCYNAGRSTGRSAEGEAWIRRFNRP